MIDWIKCSDRMPETSGRYLILEAPTESGFRYCTVIDYSAKHRQFNNYDGCEYVDREQGDAFTNVEYWMPLPAFPEEKEDNKNDHS